MLFGLGQAYFTCYTLPPARELDPDTSPNGWRGGCAEVALRTHTRILLFRHLALLSATDINQPARIMRRLFFAHTRTAFQSQLLGQGSGVEVGTGTFKKENGLSLNHFLENQYEARTRRGFLKV